MSTDTLRDPVTYPNWMWMLGVFLVLSVLVWVGAALWRWWHGEDPAAPDLLTLSEAQRRRYLGLVDEIARRRAEGDLDERDLHLALAGLMRALGTQRTGQDLESATVEEIRRLVPTWPRLVEVLEACEEASFSGVATHGQDSSQHVVELARSMVRA